MQADGQYEMSADEKAMDCKRITGSMQIAISRMRDSSGRVEPSASARVAQSAATPVFGGSSIGADRERLFARERAKLEAYNRELATRNCKQLDIEAELARAPDQPGKKYRRQLRPRVRLRGAGSLAAHEPSQEPAAANCLCGRGNLLHVCRRSCPA